jgi:hypothetical protein
MLQLRQPPSSPQPEPHPLPPPDLRQQTLPLLEQTQVWLRLHERVHNALYWGRNPGRKYPARFDDPEQRYGVLYAGSDEHCAFIETFGHITGLRTVGWGDVQRYALCRIVIDRPLQLVDLTGSGLAQLGADARLFAGEYATAQQWSRAFYKHPAQPDGVYYPSRHDPSRQCLALFDRAEPHVSALSTGNLTALTHRLLLCRILNTYRFGVHRQ